MVDFTDASVNAVSYFWTFGDLTSSTQQNPTHTYAALGNYTACLTVTGANGCTDTLCQTVNITSVGVADISIDRQVQMYPNPVQELLKIRFNKSTEGKSWTIQLTDMIGQIVEERTFKNVQSMSDYSLNVSGLAPGNYIIVLRSDDQTLQARIVKQ